MNFEKKLSRLFKYMFVPHYVQIFILKILYGILSARKLKKIHLIDIVHIFHSRDQYKIGGTLNIDMHPCYGNKSTYISFQEDLTKYKKTIISLVKKNKSTSIYKFGDGDYYFLKQQAVGSAEPGKRALSKSYDEVNHEEFIDGVLKNDFIAVEIYPENRTMFKELFSNREIDFPAEFGYGLVMNKWFFKNFSNQIGLIGGKEKMELIESLLSHQEYREYLGIDGFNDYISIPQKFACDDVNLLESDISKQLVNSTSKIFLVGIGHVKSALLHKLTKYHNAVYLDVGSGIDAIAGCINIRKPYAGNWVNFRLKHYDYSKIDYLQYNEIGKERILE